MKEQGEHTAWITAFLGGETLRDIAARTLVPYWRIRNAVLWSEAVTVDSETRYEKYFDMVRQRLRECPDVIAHKNGIGLDPKIFRRVRYALIVRGEVANTTRYKRRISIQEETRIVQLATTPGNWRKLHQLAKSTGRKGGEQAYIAAAIIGERMIHYRRQSGITIRGVCDTTGLEYGNIVRYIKANVLKMPFDEQQFIELLGAGLVMYESCNRLTPQFHNIATYYRNEYRRKYISVAYISEIVLTNRHGVNHVMARNGIKRELMIYPKTRIFAYDRERVAAYYQKRHNRNIANQLREYSNDWLRLRCDWHTWG